jgi:hypothetical protein
VDWKRTSGCCLTTKVVFPVVAGNEISVALNTTREEYVSLSVRSSMASQASDIFT